MALGMMYLPSKPRYDCPSTTFPFPVSTLMAAPAGFEQGIIDGHRPLPRHVELPAEFPHVGDPGSAHLHPGNLDGTRRAE